ncbi:MAG: hypothetical protein N3A01_09250 [Bacteroidales bacterium]|nr:hypothetical protein [Bacteroidales bacterium]
MIKVFLYFVTLLPSIFSFSQMKEYKKFYYENGNISSEGYIVNGKPDGYWKSYYRNGKLRSEGNRKNFKLDSVWVFYNDKGDTIKVINYRDNKKNGLTITYDWKYDKNGNKIKGGIVAKEIYIDDKKEGIAYYYEDNVLVRTIPYKNDKKWGIAKEYDKEGNVIAIIEYVNNFVVSREKINRRDSLGRKTGIWKTFHPNGKIKTEAYYIRDTLCGYYKEFDMMGNLIYKGKVVNGVLVKDTVNNDNSYNLRYVEDYYENGKIKSEGLFKNDLPIGLHKEYDKDTENIIGKIYDEEGRLIAEGPLDRKGRMQGKWKEYFDENKIKASGEYKDGLKEGAWLYYYEDGKLEQKGHFRKGKAQGVWTWYTQEGRVKRIENYVDGKMEGDYIEYDDSGRVVVKGKYFDGEKTGIWEFYLGDVMEYGKFTENEKDSVWIIKYSNGNIAEISNYVRGVLDGKYKEYYDNGRIKTEGFYDMGKKKKKWYFFDKNGILYLTIQYRNDKEYKINGVKVKLPRGSFE